MKSAMITRQEERECSNRRKKKVAVDGVDISAIVNLLADPRIEAPLRIKSSETLANLSLIPENKIGLSSSELGYVDALFDMLECGTFPPTKILSCLQSLAKTKQETDILFMASAKADLLLTLAKKIRTGSRNGPSVNIACSLLCTLMNYDSRNVEPIIAANLHLDALRFVREAGSHLDDWVGNNCPAGWSMYVLMLLCARDPTPLSSTSHVVYVLREAGAWSIVAPLANYDSVLGSMASIVMAFLLEDDPHSPDYTRRSLVNFTPDVIKRIVQLFDDTLHHRKGDGYSECTFMLSAIMRAVRCLIVKNICTPTLIRPRLMSLLMEVLDTFRGGKRLGNEVNASGEMMCIEASLEGLFHIFTCTPLSQYAVASSSSNTSSHDHQVVRTLFSDAFHTVLRLLRSSRVALLSKRSLFLVDMFLTSVPAMALTEMKTKRGAQERSLDDMSLDLSRVDRVRPLRSPSTYRLLQLAAASTTSTLSSSPSASSHGSVDHQQQEQQQTNDDGAPGVAVGGGEVLPSSKNNNNDKDEGKGNGAEKNTEAEPSEGKKTELVEEEPNKKASPSSLPPSAATVATTTPVDATVKAAAGAVGTMQKKEVRQNMRIMVSRFPGQSSPASHFELDLADELIKRGYDVYISQDDISPARTRGGRGGGGKTKVALNCPTFEAMNACRTIVVCVSKPYCRSLPCMMEALYANTRRELGKAEVVYAFLYDAMLVPEAFLRAAFGNNKRHSILSDEDVATVADAVSKIVGPVDSSVVKFKSMASSPIPRAIPRAAQLSKATTLLSSIRNSSSSESEMSPRYDIYTPRRGAAGDSDKMMMSGYGGPSSSSSSPMSSKGDKCPFSTSFAAPMTNHESSSSCSSKVGKKPQQSTGFSPTTSMMHSSRSTDSFTNIFPAPAPPPASQQQSRSATYSTGGHPTGRHHADHHRAIVNRRSGALVEQQGDDASVATVETYVSEENDDDDDDGEEEEEGNSGYSSAATSGYASASTSSPSMSPRGLQGQEEEGTPTSSPRIATAARWFFRSSHQTFSALIGRNAAASDSPTVGDALANAAAMTPRTSARRDDGEDSDSDSESSSTDSDEDDSSSGSAAGETDGEEGAAIAATNFAPLTTMQPRGSIHTNQNKHRKKGDTQSSYDRPLPSSSSSRTSHRPHPSGAFSPEDESPNSVAAPAVFRRRPSLRTAAVVGVLKSSDDRPRRISAERVAWADLLTPEERARRGSGSPAATARSAALFSSKGMDVA